MPFFEDILTRHNDATVAYVLRHAPKSPVMTEADFAQFAQRLVGLMNNLVLTKISANDPILYQAIQRARDEQINVQLAEKYVKSYIDGFRAAIATDPRLSQTQREQAERQLEQACRYLLMVILPIYRLEPLKEQVKPQNSG